MSEPDWKALAIALRDAVEHMETIPITDFAPWQDTLRRIRGISDRIRRAERGERCES